MHAWENCSHHSQTAEHLQTEEQRDTEQEWCGDEEGEALVGTVEDRLCDEDGHTSADEDYINRADYCVSKM